MKNILNIFLVLMVVISSYSCKKFLDLQPVDQIGEDVALDTKDKIERALVGAYNQLGQGNYYGFEWMNAVWLGDGDVVPFGAGTTDLQFYNHTIVPSSNTISINWQSMYQVINQTNNVISAVRGNSDPGYSSDERNNDLGQALFIRGLVYFDLARTFGGTKTTSDLCVPLILQPTRGLDKDSYPARNTCAEVYTQVGKDLDSAEMLLPLSDNRNVATKMAAIALKARLNLYLENWSVAEQLATTVILDNTYGLVIPFENLITQKNTSEAIFELSYSSVQQNPLSYVFLPTSMSGQYRIGPSNNFLSLINNPSIGGDRKIMVAVDPAGNPYCNKYRSLATTGQSDDDVIVLRLAEMYLIRAEARANQNNVSGALSDLNVIRQRSHVPVSVASTVSDVLLNIENERRMEFAFEPFRWFDLIRTNRIGTVLGLTDKNKFVFPLPASEVLANGNLTQNPGY